jgi:DNA-binding NarL/FixJ family response regulator
MALTMVLADDHPVVRLGLRSALESEPGLQLIGEAADGLEVLPLETSGHPFFIR